MISISYNLPLMLIAILFRIIAIIVGFYFYMAANSFLILFGCFTMIFFVYDFFNVVSFDKLIFYETKIVKEDSFLGKVFKNKRELKYAQMEVTIIKEFFGGALMFSQKNRRMQTILFFRIDLLPVSNDDLKKIKDILLQKKVISKDSFQWNL
ncbi:MAG: hypothetical protein LBP54_08190 [Campylobacteraceae bacterium]|nr:hypothetical protein [Campylobacteraceae bacterium]